MDISTQLAAELGVALNEATLLGIEYDPGRNIAGVTLAVLTLPESGPEPEDPRRVFVFSDVGRIAASLRRGWWDDEDAPPEAFHVEQLLSAVKSFGGCPIYGWEFFNVDDQKLKRWTNRLSLDLRPVGGSTCNYICLFQEDAKEKKVLDICIWFESFRICDSHYNEITVADFIAGGRRWWDALHAGDPRTDGHGIVPGGA